MIAHTPSSLPLAIISQLFGCLHSHIQHKQSLEETIGVNQHAHAHLSVHIAPSEKLNAGNEPFCATIYNLLSSLCDSLSTRKRNRSDKVQTPSSRKLPHSSGSLLARTVERRMPNVGQSPVTPNCHRGAGLSRVGLASCSLPIFEPKSCLAQSPLARRPPLPTPWPHGQIISDSLLVSLTTLAWYSADGGGMDDRPDQDPMVSSSRAIVVPGLLSQRR
ncbi:hypothetical protein MA16_Dca006860 [Dendrobium catenatum]|uniref:Uncharacterized protein n=1 Tax=Dendrobium catenatum TaxID=906689 RepID=A0A2I0VT01_9ASPA|nr:hypothetical protein MA16_Dca006860 [Dendrobium catenatum]